MHGRIGNTIDHLQEEYKKIPYQSVRCKGYPECASDLCQHIFAHRLGSACIPLCFEGKHCSPAEGK